MKLKSGKATYLDKSIIEYISKVTVVIIKDGLQMIFYKDLHVSPHYSVNYGEYQDICTTLASGKIELVVFGTECNNCHPKQHVVMVTNKFVDEPQWFKHFEYKETLAWIRKAKQVDKKRHVRAKHIALSVQVGNSWVKKVVGKVVVNKPGFSNQICYKRRLAVSRALGHMGLHLKTIMIAEKMPIFQDMHRKMEFSDALAVKLNANREVFFEGVSVQHLEGELGIHVDKQNDSIPGYNWSAVVAMTKDGSRLTINGYSRKCGKDYMDRLRNAQKSAYK